MKSKLHLWTCHEVGKWTAAAVHTDSRNRGAAALALLGDFVGGLLVWTTGAFFREVHTWIFSNGHLPHWTTPVTQGERYSMIAYTLDGDRGGATFDDEAEENSRRVQE